LKKILSNIIDSYLLSFLFLLFYFKILELRSPNIENEINQYQIFFVNLLIILVIFLYFSIKEIKLSFFLNKKIIIDTIFLTLLLLLYSFLNAYFSHFYNYKNETKIYFLVLLISPFYEETFYRLYLNYKSNYFIVSLIFAFFHIQDFTASSLIKFLFTFVSSITIFRFYKKNKNVLNIFLAHLFHNIIISLIILYT